MGVVGSERLHDPRWRCPPLPGVHGPGEITMCVGASELDSSIPHLIAATDNRLFPKLADVAGEIVDERVAVIEDQDHLSL